MPFDQFTVEQLAGDLLPQATLDQKIATGFHRNTMVNFGNGSDPKEYLAKAVMDRVNTTATVWLGLTLGCAQCHDHKYDPLRRGLSIASMPSFTTCPRKGWTARRRTRFPALRLPRPSKAGGWWNCGSN